MSDPGLCAFLKAANENEQDCLNEYADFVQFIDKIDGLFRNLVAAELRGDPLAATLFMNAHASFLAACRIAFCGQSPPTFMALRGALESAFYGLIASRNEENRSVWLKRTEDLDRSRKVYTARNAIRLLKCDPNLQAMTTEAYELTIEFGAHPNFRSVIEHVKFGEGPHVTLVYLQAIPSTQAVRPILACIETGLVILFMCPHVFPDHAAAMAAHTEASTIRRELDQSLVDHDFFRAPDQKPGQST